MTHYIQKEIFQLHKIDIIEEIFKHLATIKFNEKQILSTHIAY